MTSEEEPFPIEHLLSVQEFMKYVVNLLGPSMCAHAFDFECVEFPHGEVDQVSPRGGVKRFDAIIQLLIFF